MKPGATGVKRLFNATRYSISGFKAAWQHEAAFRQELILGIVLIPAAFFITDSIPQTLLLIFSTVLVIIVELINSAIEAVVDRIGNEIHELAGRAKDIGSAAVFLSLANMFFLYTVTLISFLTE
jgi:diacylglycerol kinase (ATP)